MFNFLSKVVDFIGEMIVETSRQMKENPWKYY